MNFEQRLEQSYRQLGPRYARAVLAAWIASSPIWGLAATVAFSLFLKMNLAQFLETFAVATGGQIVATALTARRIGRVVEPVNAWMSMRSDALATQRAWGAMSGLLPRALWIQGWRSVLFTGVPFVVYLSLAFDLGAADAASASLVLLLAASYPIVVVYFSMEAAQRPVLRDVAACLGPGQSAGPVGLPVRIKLLVALPLMTVATTVAASVVSTAWTGNSLGTVQRDATLGALLALGTSLALTLMAVETVVGPVEDLLDATRRIQRGDVAARAAVTSGDELGVLARSFNSMLGAVADRAQLRDQALRLESEEARHARDRELATMRAIATERTRIARDLHDVVSHGLALVSHQAAVVRDHLGREPRRATEALASIERQGRDTLTELRRFLGVLREHDSGARRPQPRISDLEALARDVRAAGLTVSIKTEGALSDLTPGLEISAYRIVQESLTNVIQHAHASRVDVVLRRGSYELEIRVSDDGRGPPGGSGQVPGSGLIGMRERVAVFGGTLEHGSESDRGGYVVHARLPLAAVAVDRDGPNASETARS